MERALLGLAHGSTLVLCALLKLPQLRAVLAARSARGLSLHSLALELAGFLVFLRYQIYYGYPLLTYLEYPILVAQDVILLLCVLHYSGKMEHVLPYIAIFVGGWYLLTLQKWIIDLAMNLCTLISAASKLAQLRCLWQTRDSGQVSALTWSMSAFTCATRIFTTVMTTNDLMVLVRFVIMLVLNIWVTTTILRYRKTEKTD
ncbi:solute carrier family 66 member 3 isoform X2 [Alligator mississippiensis]|uniref:Solute carrier family 66 member 3 n=1 Tax=Alligator mississippiensis TaxID=8496 RepID=A0A151N8C5_ALLMI|nr:solute carrier family 66 member 3 isoform X2 [Alligator mississippiensis]KYO33007.1 PQ-loop repeat-containing protein 3 [Alligator mississippiensis]